MARTTLNSDLWLVTSRSEILSREPVIRHHHNTEAHGKWKWGDSVPANLINNSSFFILATTGFNYVVGFGIVYFLVPGPFSTSLHSIFAQYFSFSAFSLSWSVFFEKPAHSPKQSSSEIVKYATWRLSPLLTLVRDSGSKYCFLQSFEVKLTRF